MSRVLAVAAALAGGVALLPACGAILGIDDVPPVGAGDAGDAAARHADATKPDQSAEDVGPTRDRDADTPLLDARDAAPLEASCAETSFPDAASIACPAAESGICAPMNLAGWVDTWRPPEVARGACTEDQVTEVVNDCLGTADGGAAACASFLNDASNQQCRACLFTPATNATLGPLMVFPPGTVVINIGGCVALVDPCQTACAAAFEANEICPQTACESSCADTTSSTLDSECVTEARQCTCLHEATSVGACGPVSTTSPTDQCFPSSANGGFLGRAAFMGMLFCGPAGDAG